MSRVLIYVDPSHPEYSLELIEAAGQIAPEGGLVSYAFCPGEIAKGIDGYFDCCFWMPGTPVAPFDAMRLAECLESLQKQYEFDAILLPATHWGRMLAPRTAMRLGVGLVADITAIEHDGNGVLLVRPAFDGKMLAVIECSVKKPLMASIRAGIFHTRGCGGKITERIPYSFTPTSSAGCIRLLSAERKPAPADIRESEILVSGGGGVDKDIARLEPLARALNGMVAASRRIVDKGIAPRAIQVGQSGKTVSPKLYFALGIYGSLQHIEGIKNAGSIISVNVNQDAPICSLSDIVVVGEAVEFAEKLADKIERQRILNSENRQNPK